MAVSLAACGSKVNTQNLLTKEGIARYELSESENYILELFGMEDTAKIISYLAPKEAKNIKINVYRLEDGKNGVILGTDLLQKMKKLR